MNFQYKIIKIIFFAVFLLSVFFCNKVKAQKASSFKTYYKLKERKNALKIGLPALFFNNVNVKYQHIINEKLSFQLSWAKYFETDLVKRFEGKIYRFRELEADLTNFNEGGFYGYNVVLPELKMSGFYTQAELRYQFSKKKLWTGFYLGMFSTYHQNFLNNISAYDDLGYNYSGQIDLQVFNTGLQSGYQWLINKFLLIDFHFLGVGWLWVNHNVTLTTDNDNLKFDIINEDLNTSLATDLNFKEKNYSTTTFENGLEYSLKQTTPMFRTGISIGILF